MKKLLIRKICKEVVFEVYSDIHFSDDIYGGVYYYRLDMINHIEKTTLSKRFNLETGTRRKDIQFMTYDIVALLKQGDVKCYTYEIESLIAFILKSIFPLTEINYNYIELFVKRVTQWEGVTYDKEIICDDEEDI